MRRGALLALVAVVLAASPLAASADPEPPPTAPTSAFLVGIDDDHSKWLARPDGLLARYRDLGLEAVRITIPWRRGRIRATTLVGTYLHRAASLVARGQRVVIAVFGKPSEAPVDARSRKQYCDFLHYVLVRIPFRDVVIWNEANSPQFWPASAGAPAYEALLAACWRRLHALRRDVNVISTTAAHYDPAGFVRALGAAYRERGRLHPILDTFGHNPYPENASGPPWAQHDDPRTVGQGDLERLLRAIRDAFEGTAQPLPGERRTTVWYLETGFQTTVPRTKRRYYNGVETDRFVVSARHEGGRSGRSRPGPAAPGRPVPRPLPARGRRVLQLRAARRGPARWLAVRRPLARRDGEGFLRRVQGGHRRRRLGRGGLRHGSRCSRPAAAVPAEGARRPSRLRGGGQARRGATLRAPPS